MTTMQQWTPTMAQKLRTSCSNIASCHAQNVKQHCQTLSLSWLRIISHAASRSISWRIISCRHNTEVTRATFHHTFMIDHALWFFTALTESPTAQSSQLSPSMMLTARRASLKLRRKVDIGMRSTLEWTQLKRCLHAHVKIGYGTNCHVSTSLQYFSTGKNGNGSSYLQNTLRVPTSQWM